MHMPVDCLACSNDCEGLVVVVVVVVVVIVIVVVNKGVGFEQREEGEGEGEEGSGEEEEGSSALGPAGVATESCQYQYVPARVCMFSSTTTSLGTVRPHTTFAPSRAATDTAMESVGTST